MYLSILRSLKSQVVRGKAGDVYQHPDIPNKDPQEQVILSIIIGDKIPEREGTLGCLLHQSPKFLGDFYYILNGCFIKLSVQTCQPLTRKGGEIELFITQSQKFFGELYYIFVGWFSILSVQTFQPLIVFLSYTIQGGRGHWVVYYTSPQSFT